MIPGPRPSDGQSRPLPGPGDLAVGRPDGECAPVALTRTPSGWVVRSAAAILAAGDLIEGMSLADLVAEELGWSPEPDRSARRSARGSGGAGSGAADDPAAARIAALERTVSQLEHALAARVATERAIGVLAERHALSARAAFEVLRRDARSQGRPVAELAREVLDGLPVDAPPTPAAEVVAEAVAGVAGVVAVATVDGRS